MAARPLDALAQDLRSALRRLRRAPTVSALVVASLALGIGVNTALFSVARAVLVTPVPYQDAERVVLVQLHQQGKETTITEAHAVRVGQLARSLERVEAYRYERAKWRRGNSTVSLLTLVLTPQLPSAMEILPLTGRPFAVDDGEKSGEPVALISEGLWHREFSGAPDVLGSTLVLDDVRHVVIGVTRPPVSDLEVDVWVPRRLDPNGSRSLSVVAWLRPGTSLEQANAELRRLSPEVTSDPAGALEVRASRPGDYPLREYEQVLLLFWGASGFVLAIVCSNVANLLLARNLASQRELGIRAALGASRARIVRLLMMESAVLGVIGGIGGVFVTAWTLAGLLALRPRSLSFVYPAYVAVDASVLGYVVLLSVVTGLLVGAVPALRAARADPLRGVGRDDQHAPRTFAARSLFGCAVALQTALALMLLVGAGLMLASYYRLIGAGPGFDPEDLAVMTIELDPSQHADVGGRRQFFVHLLERVARVGGVREAALATDAPAHTR